MWVGWTHELSSCSAKLDFKSRKQSGNQEMEEELFDWFRRHERRQAVIADCALQARLKRYVRNVRSPSKQAEIGFENLKQNME